jgi:hypothetical protein
MKIGLTEEIMKNDLETLLELVIEYFSNTNAAGEYDGKDPRLEVLAEDTILKLAYKVQQQEQMRNWNI